MPVLDNVELDKEFDLSALEAECRILWEETGIYRYDPSAEGQVFAVDTPPPYVSASHLHVGHAMSYTQAEIVVRYHRMKGRTIFYPMGFDDNGLPTERHVEKLHGINKKKTTRADFRALCLEETRQGAKAYEELWRALGLSVDWTLRYSTIDDHCRKTSQHSFIDLHQKGRMYRSNEPVLWDTHFETALAQADLDTIRRKAKLHDIAFKSPEGEDLIISTTRPELIPACVALYCNPHDERYTNLVGRTAITPITGHEVQVKTDEDVLPEFGTGLMMVCTFGDGEDVKKWKRDGLDTRVIIGANGKLLDAAGKYAGMDVNLARKKIVADIEEAGLYRGVKTVDQNVSVSERSEVPVEFVMAPQWFIRVLDIKEELLMRSTELQWHPAEMKVRLDQWVSGLKYDWNISRQRFYGVPIPVWYCEVCENPHLPPIASLPVDPLEDVCPYPMCEKCGHNGFRGEADVFDTWMTSSLSPLINANWAGSDSRKGTMEIYPSTVRVQAHEIIRTWLFYTVVKSHLHTNSVPFVQTMISGWGLNEQGKKISKRDLEKFTDADGFNRYEPYAVVRKYGADALRYWAASSNLGSDTRYSEREVKSGRRLVVKLWNACRFGFSHLQGFDPDASRIPFSERTPEDRWLLTELNRVIPRVDDAMLGYNYAKAREAVDDFFWNTFCDNYLELIKDRFWRPDAYDNSHRESACATLWESMRVILSLYAPVVPFITEALYQRLYKSQEDQMSVHVAGWPTFDPARDEDVPEMAVLEPILRVLRQIRTELRVSQTRTVPSVTIDISEATSELAETIRSMEPSLFAIARAERILYGAADTNTALDKVRVSIQIPES
ncbi:MAG: valine--tRNA ligase [Myxococcales bacterium]|nr:valine--tRNA ligase [Myxococcales bacterium]